MEQLNHDTSTPSIPKMFLASDQWSPRFEGTFFTVKMKGYELLRSLPESAESSRVAKGKGTFPAYYYTIDVCCGHAKHTIQRRFSQFDWLLSHIPSHNWPNLPTLPPKTWICQSQDAKFAMHRLEQLGEFLGEFLSQPGIATDPSVVEFLELEQFAK